MKKNDFELRFNRQKEEWYVVKVKDELTKNHRDMENLVSGVMPENKDDIMCPVKSFRTYIEHLNPNNDYMWQYPLDVINPTRPNIWYGKQHIGKNPLASFMSEVSRYCGLSQIYTNHSIRVTGCTVLTRCQFSSSEIMSVSGHKSVQSLAIYQKTKHNQKVEMGKALFQSMKVPEENIMEAKKKELPPPNPKKMIESAHVNDDMAAQSELAVVPKSNVMPNAIPFEADFSEEHDIPDIDLLSALCGINENPVSVANTVANTSNVMIPKSMFTNCQIGTINFTFNRK